MVHDELLLALAYGQLGQLDAARRWLAIASTWMDRNRGPTRAASALGGGAASLLSAAMALLVYQPDPRSKKDDETMRVWIEMDILRAEVETVLAGTPKH